MRRVISMCCSLCRQGELASTSTLHWEYSRGATVIFLGPPVTQQRRYEWQRSLATQSEYMVDSVITHANKTASTVYWKCLLCSSFIVHSYVCIPSNGYNNDYTATALRTATLTRYTVGVYNSSIWMHLVSSKCVLC